MAINQVTESFYDAIAEGVVDEANHVIRNVSILGVVSKNRRRYPKEVMKAAAHLYEGAVVNVDHRREGETSRSFWDRFGMMKNVRQEGERLKADFDYNPEHQGVKQFLWAVKNQPKTIGFSHVAMVKEKRVGSTYVVEAIDQVKSVDLVADSATTGGVFEDEETELQTTGRGKSLSMLSDDEFAHIDEGGKRDAGGKTSPRSLRKFPLDSADSVRVALNTIPKMGWDASVRDQALSRARRAAARFKVKVSSQSEGDAMEWDDLTLEDVRSRRPDLAEAIVKESASANDLTKANDAIKSLKAQIATFEAEKKSREAREAIVEELKAAKLDPEDKRQVGTAFRKALERCESKDDRAELIEERVQELEDAGIVLGERRENEGDGERERDDRRGDGGRRRERSGERTYSDQRGGSRERSESVKVKDSEDFAHQLTGRFA